MKKYLKRIVAKTMLFKPDIQLFQCMTWQQDDDEKFG